MAEKQKRGEAMYQGAIKDKNAIMTQLASKESEIGMYYVLNNFEKKSPVLYGLVGCFGPIYFIDRSIRCDAPPILCFSSLFLRWRMTLFCLPLDGMCGRR